MQGCRHQPRSSLCSSPQAQAPECPVPRRIRDNAQDSTLALLRGAIDAATISDIGVCAFADELLARAGGAGRQRVGGNSPRAPASSSRRSTNRCGRRTTCSSTSTARGSPRPRSRPTSRRTARSTCSSTSRRTTFARSSRTRRRAPNKAAGTDAQKIGDFYESFMDEARADELGMKPLETEFAAIDRIATKSRPRALLRAHVQAEPAEPARRLRRRRCAAARPRNPVRHTGRPRPSRPRLLPEGRRGAQAVPREVCRVSSRSC